MFRKIIYLFVFHMLVLCGVSFAGRMSADELSAMMAEDVRIAQELINEMPAEERRARGEKRSAGYVQPPLRGGRGGIGKSVC